MKSILSAKFAILLQLQFFLDQFLVPRSVMIHFIADGTLHFDQIFLRHDDLIRKSTLIFLEYSRIEIRDY